MLRTTRIVVVVGLALAAWFTSANAQSLNKNQQEVWQSIEDRWRLWQSNNLEKMLSFYHPKFHRWSTARKSLDSLDGLLNRFQRVKKLETIVSYTLEPVDIEVFGKFAAIHYISRETVRLEAEAPPVIAGRFKAGETYVATIRWSDYLIKEKGRWFYIGGARDDTCSIAERAAFPCRSN